MAPAQRKDYLALVDELTEHDRRYYVDAEPSISDVEYDKLSNRLREVETAHPDCGATSAMRCRTSLMGS